MSTSLKAFIPALARLLEQNPNGLYERQRALIRAGLLEARAGRGPGSGVEATPASVAMLLVSVLATDSLSEVEWATRAGAELTDQTPTTFAEALTAILGSETLAAECRGVTFIRNQPSAIIYIKNGPKDGRQFLSGHETLRLIVVQFHIVGDIMQRIAKELARAR